MVAWELILGKCFFYRVEDTRNIFLHLIVPETNHLVSLRFQILGSHYIIFGLFQMSTPIQFDDQFSLDGNEIDNKFSDGMLAAKINAL